VTPILNGTTSDGKNKTATFTFSTLNAPYVILVKARPTDDTAAGYFDKNQSTTVTNSLNLKTENWTPGISTSQNVKIDSTILSKNLDSSKANSEAYLTWTVEYKPYELNGKGTQIVDTLPEGIDLRTDASGNLALTDRDGHANISINELTLQADGSYTVGDPVAPASGTNVSYDSVGRALTFKIPDPAKAYRFTYVTDITGNSGSITNQVKLYGGNSNNVGTNKSYNIVEQSGWATLQRGGSLTVTKTDETGTALTGAVFTLYASDGTTVIRKGTVAADGTLKMRAIPEGKYILRETAIPGGYLSENVSATPTDHTVTVTVSGSTVTTSIDGKTGADSNTLTVKNYKAGTVGNLTISKTVAGNAADTKKTFDFTVTFANANGAYTYTKDGVAAGTISSGDKISLAHGQSIAVAGLPKGTTYVVTESNYSADGYSTVSTVTAAKTVGDNSTATGGTVTGTIVADDTQTASFTNTRNVYVPSTGNLTISKTVAGPGADTAKKFNFTITFTGAPGSYPYTGNGVPDGTIQSGDTIALAHGQSITITGLPAGASYQVSEDAASAQGYTMESAGSSGTISVGDQTAAFTNTKITNPGSLTIHKVVEGKGASQTRKFRFTVTFTGAPDAYPYAGSASGTLHSGDAVMLSSGQSITIAGLPAGAGYTVTEADYSGVGYTTSSTGASGVISSGTTQTASFTNSWSPLPNEPGKPQNPTMDIGDEDIPTGNTDGENHDVPDGGNDVNTPDGEESGLPRTGDDQKNGLAKFGLFFSSAALAVLAAADYVLRRKNHGKKNK
jgi:ribosomal protein L2